MTDTDAALAALDKKTNRLLEEVGITPDGPPDQLTYETGLELGKRFASLLPVEQSVFDAVAFEILDSFADLFPEDPDPETLEFQAYFLGPFLSKLISGRGLTIPQLAIVAGVSAEHVYRLHRNGLTILYKHENAVAVTGVNRRYSGLDGRESHLVIDHEGFVTKPWPEPAGVFQPFIVGLITGVRSWLDDPHLRGQLEAGIRGAITKVMVDPVIGDLFDGVTEAGERVATALRDSVLVMKSEKGRATDFVAALAGLRTHRHQFLDAMAEATRQIRREGATR